MTSKAKNLTAYGGLLPVATMLEKLGFQQLVEETLTVKRITRAMPMYQFVLGMVLAAVRRFSAAESSAVSGTGADADRHPEGVALAAAVHLLAFSGVAASGHRAATAGSAAAHARTGVGGGPRATDGGHAGHRHHRAHACSAARWAGARATTRKNKGKKSYQPILTFLAETQGVHRRRVAQRGPAYGRADRAASGKRVRGPAAAGEDDLRPRRFGLLLLGGGGSL